MEAGDYDYTYSTVDYQYKTQFHYWPHPPSFIEPRTDKTEHQFHSYPNRSVTGVASKSQLKHDGLEKEKYSNEVFSNLPNDVTLRTEFRQGLRV